MNLEIDEKELWRLTEELIAIPSTTLDGDEIYDFALNYLRSNGVDASAQNYSNMYPMVLFNKPPNIVGSLGDENKTTVHLNCHLDTVSPSDSWHTDPYSPMREGSKLFGLGACDMKAGAAVLLYIMKTLAENPQTLKKRVVLSCVSGEEAPYSLGTDALMKMNDLSGTDLVIIPEPSPVLSTNDHCVVHGKRHRSGFPSIIVGAAGRRIYAVGLYGRSAHASHPDRGVNALEEAARIITNLKDFNLFYTIKGGSGHYCILRLDGGDETFTVPGHCSMLVNRQMVLGEKERDIKKEIKGVISRLGLKSKIRIEKRFSPLPELEYDPYVCEGGKELQEFIGLVEEETGKKQCRFITRSVGDFNYFGSRLKKPTVVFGPGGDHIHAPGEYVIMDQAVETARLVLKYLTG